MAASVTTPVTEERDLPEHQEHASTRTPTDREAEISREVEQRLARLKVPAKYKGKSKSKKRQRAQWRNEQASAIRQEILRERSTTSAPQRRESSTSAPTVDPQAGMVSVGVQPSDTSSSTGIRGMGQVTEQEHPHAVTITLPQPMIIRGKRFVAKFTVPSLKPREELSAEELAEMEDAVQTWCDAFVRVANERLPQDTPIAKARNFNAVAAEKDVYIYTENPEQQWQYETESAEAALKRGCMQHHCIIDGAVGEQLSGAISACSGQAMKKYLAQAEALQTYMHEPQEAQATTPCYEVNLVNIGNTCYINSVFQQIATNKEILDYLVKNPQLFDGKAGVGKQNAFWQALRDYQQRQRTPNPDPLSLRPLYKALGFRNVQSDSDEALLALMNELTVDASSELLYACTQDYVGAQNPDTQKIKVRAASGDPQGMMVGRLNLHPGEEEVDLETILGRQDEVLPDNETNKATIIFPAEEVTGEEAKEVRCTQKICKFQKPPMILMLNVARQGVGADYEHIPDHRLDSLVSYLMQEGIVRDADIAQLVGADDVQAWRDAVAHATKDTDGAPAERIRLGRLIVNKTEHPKRFQNLLKMLSPEQKRVVYSWIPVHKIDTPVICPLELTLPAVRLVTGEPAKYHLMSYSCHTGTDGNGHYVTYFCRNGKYFLANDKERQVKEVSREVFEEQATKAIPSTIVYNHENVAQQATSTSPAPTSEHEETGSERSTTGSSPIDLDTTDFEGGLYKCSVQCADTVQNIPMSVPLVNPTNPAVTLVHPTIKEEDQRADEEQNPDAFRVRITEAKAAKISERSWPTRKVKSSKSYKLGTRWIKGSSAEVMVAQGDETHHPVYHVGCSTPIDRDQITYAVHAAMKKAREEGVPKIVFLVPEVHALTNQVFVTACKDAVRSYAEDHNTATQGVEVAILLSKQQAQSSAAYQEKVREAQTEEVEEPRATTTPKPVKVGTFADLTPKKKIKIQKVPARESAAPENAGDRDALRAKMATGFNKSPLDKSPLILDLCPGTPATESALHIDTRAYTGCSVQVAVEEFTAMLAKYVHKRATDGNPMEITLVVPVGTDTAHLEEVIASLQMDTSGIQPQADGKIEWVDQYHDSLVAFEQTDQERVVTGTDFVHTSPPAVRTGFSSEAKKEESLLRAIQEHINGTEGQTCIIDLRSGHKTTTCPIVFQEHGYQKTDDALQALFGMFRGAKIDPKGKRIQIILPSSIDMSGEGYPYVNVFLAEGSRLWKETASKVRAERRTEARERKAKVREEQRTRVRPSKKRRESGVQALKGVRLSHTTEEQAHIEKVCHKAHLFNPGLGGSVVVWRAKPANPKPDHDQELVDATEINWDVVLEGDVIDCRPGTAPAETPEGVKITYLDFRAFGSDFQRLLETLQAERARSKTVLKPLKLILPTFEVTADGVIQGSSPQPAPQSSSGFKGMFVSGVSALWSATGSLGRRGAKATQSAAQRADYTSGWTESIPTF